MKKHVMVMAYAPKILYVRSGECRHTIRAGNKVSDGDQILFHGWAGAPYRSKWSWRLRVDVTDVVPIMVDYLNGIRVDNPFPPDLEWHDWESQYANDLATHDFIDPPTGAELRDVLVGNGASFVNCQIIRWVSHDDNRTD